MAIWRFDTEPDPEFPLYTRGNIGEVFPDVVTPLTFSLFAQRMENGWRRLWTKDGPILPPSDRPWRILGFFGGYAYLNLSIMRRSADLAPGTSPEEIDHQFFAVGIELPPYEPPDEPGYDERKELVGEWVQSMLRNPPRAANEADRAMAFTIRRLARGAHEEASDDALLIDMRNMALRAEILFYDHIATSGVSSVAFGGLQQGLRERLGERGDELARRAVSGLGEVDSAGPANAIRELAGLTGDARDRAMEAFLAEHGFRGANEWELAAPSWELVPEVVTELARKAEGSEDKRPPAEVRAEAVAEIEREVTDWEELPFWLEACRFYIPGRERTKTNCIVIYNEARLDANVLARRLADRGLLDAPEQVFLLTMDELEDACHRGKVPDDLAERGRELDELRSRMPPVVVMGEVPPVDDWTSKADAAAGTATDAPELHGVAGSPGLAKGRVRVVGDPYRATSPAPGEILVAPITDPGWTPMFIPAAGVIVEVGGELSHAVIVARELGIPAVVAATGACSSLRDGDLVEVNGSEGVVKILERGG